MNEGGILQVISIVVQIVSVVILGPIIAWFLFHFEERKKQKNKRNDPERINRIETEVRKNLRTIGEESIIIRNINKSHDYPEKGYSKCGFYGFYHDGIQICYGAAFGISYIKKVAGDTWTHCSEKDENSMKVWGIYKIPYRNIDHVNWHGNEIDPEPHFFCFWDSKYKPAENHVYCERKKSSIEGTDYFTEIVNTDKVEGEKNGKPPWE